MPLSSALHAEHVFHHFSLSLLPLRPFLPFCGILFFRPIVFCLIVAPPIPPYPPSMLLVNVQLVV